LFPEAGHRGDVAHLPLCRVASSRPPALTMVLPRPTRRNWVCLAQLTARPEGRAGNPGPQGASRPAGIGFVLHDWLRPIGFVCIPGPASSGAGAQAFLNPQSAIEDTASGPRFGHWVRFARFAPADPTRGEELGSFCTNAHHRGSEYPARPSAATKTDPRAKTQRARRRGLVMVLPLALLASLRET
jgi:hypothetical protein